MYSGISSNVDVSFASDVEIALKRVTNCGRKICNTTDIVYSIIWVIAMFSCCCCVSDSEVVAMFILDFHWKQRGLLGGIVYQDLKIIQI